MSAIGFPLRCLNYSQSPQVSRTFFRILSDITDAVVWVVSLCSLNFKPFTPCTHPLVNVVSAPITAGFSVILMFYSFSVHYQGLSIYLSFRFLSVFLCVRPGRQSLLFFMLLLFFSLTNTSSGRLAEIGLCICILKSEKILFV